MKPIPVSAHLGNLSFFLILSKRNRLLLHNWIENTRLTDYAVLSAKCLTPMSIMSFFTYFILERYSTFCVCISFTHNLILHFFFWSVFSTIFYTVLSHLVSLSRYIYEQKPFSTATILSQHCYILFFIFSSLSQYIKRPACLAVFISLSSNTVVDLFIAAEHTTYLKLPLFLLLMFCHVIKF